MRVGRLPALPRGRVGAQHMVRHGDPVIAQLFGRLRPVAYRGEVGAEIPGRKKRAKPRHRSFPSLRSRQYRPEPPARQAGESARPPPAQAPIHGSVMICHVLSCSSCSGFISRCRFGHAALLSGWQVRYSIQLLRLFVFGIGFFSPFVFVPLSPPPRRTRRTRRTLQMAALAPPPGSPTRRDPDSRVFCARPRRCGRVSAPARFARLIARASRRTHVSRRLFEDFFAPAPAWAEAASGHHFLFVLYLFYHAFPERKSCAAKFFMFSAMILIIKKTFLTSVPISIRSPGPGAAP